MFNKFKKVVHFKIVESRVNSEIFGEFIKELCSKITNEEKEKSLFIYDNAACHKTKSIKNICKENKLKVLTNIPYKSESNGIEFFFGYFKNEYYKYIFNNSKEQIDKIKEIFNSEQIINNIKSFYLQAFTNYLKFLNQVGNNYDINIFIFCGKI